MAKLFIYLLIEGVLPRQPHRVTSGLPHVFQHHAGLFTNTSHSNTGLGRTYISTIIVSPDNGVFGIALVYNST